MQARPQSSYLSQLYTLAKTGAITWKLYNSLKSASPSKQKAAITKLSTGKGTTRRRSEVTVLKKQVKNIKQQLQHDFAYHTNRRIDSGVMLCSENQQQIYNLQTGTSVSYIEAAMALLRYYNPSAPGTLVTADASTGTYTRNVTIKNIGVKFRFKNNYQVPVNLVLYECYVKDDTSISPGTTVSNGLADQCISSPGVSGMYVYPTDSNQFNDIWSVKKTTQWLLQPGSAKNYTMNTGSFAYDPSLIDSHALTYQKGNKGAVLMIRIFGDPGHDTVNGEYGTTDAGCDWTAVISTKIEYDAGTSLNDFSYDNNLDVFTNGSVCSNKPVSDNQGFEIA